LPNLKSEKQKNIVMVNVASEIAGAIRTSSDVGGAMKTAAAVLILWAASVGRGIMRRIWCGLLCLLLVSVAGSASQAYGEELAMAGSGSVACSQINKDISPGMGWGDDILPFRFGDGCKVLFRAST
jgi:hypothetical protein